jgi:RNA 2',3'-cyclic 3'-phosphodiesterase
MRLFVGIALEKALVRELMSVVSRLQLDQRKLRSSAGRMRCTAPESWHITLQFLGNATEDQYQCLIARLSEVRSAPVPVQSGELGCFERAGIFFADVEVSPELTALQKSVVAATSRCGFKALNLPFHPHITLARAKGQGRGLRLHEIVSELPSRPKLTGFTAQEYLLYESHLSSAGSRYEVRARFPLGPRAGYTDKDESDR